MKELFENLGKWSIVVVLLFSLKYVLGIEISGHWFLQGLYLGGVMVIGWIVYPKIAMKDEKETENE